MFSQMLMFSMLSVASSYRMMKSASHMIQSRQHKSYIPLFSDTLAEAEAVSNTGLLDGMPTKSLTQKEYMIAVRNRLFSVQEQIWLHDHLEARPGAKIQNISQQKYNELIINRGKLMEEYPLTYLYLDLKQAKDANMPYAAMHIERLISDFKRKIPISMEHVNQIAVLSFAGQVVNLMRGQGAMHHRLLPSNVITQRGVKRQFQHPVFSSDSRFIAFSELHFHESTVVRSDAIIYEVPKDPKVFGQSDSTPIFDSGDLPGCPFFLRFSPDDSSLAMICALKNNDTNGFPTSSIVLLDWKKFYGMDTLAGMSDVSRFVTRTATTIMQGAPLFFAYTTSDPKNATIVARCDKQVVDKNTNATVFERAVWMLARQDTGGVQDTQWEKIADVDSGSTKWSVPVCHSAGGGDSVTIIQNGWLVSRSLSRWKRGADMQPRVKQLMKVQGQVNFMSSPDHSRLIVLQEDVSVGLHSLSVIEGESALDPCSPDVPNVIELPFNRISVAFWFSPDSTKLLILTLADKFREDVKKHGSSLRVGLNSDMQWMVYNFPLGEMKEYEVFKPTPYFMKCYVPFFCQYSQVYNPWSPDSLSFIYSTSTGLIHTPVVPGKPCLGVDAWQNQGATFGIWSRM